MVFNLHSNVNTKRGAYVITVTISSGGCHFYYETRCRCQNQIVEETILLYTLIHVIVCLLLSFRSSRPLSRIKLYKTESLAMKMKITWICKFAKVFCLCGLSVAYIQHLRKVVVLESIRLTL